MALLSVNNVTKRFGGLVAVDHVSFEVNQGEVISLIGPNGAGKTTVFNMLTGVYQIDGGEIIFEDRPIHNLAPQEIVAAGISRIGRHPYPHAVQLFRFLFPHWTLSAGGGEADAQGAGYFGFHRSWSLCERLRIKPALWRPAQGGNCPRHRYRRENNPVG